MSKATVTLSQFAFNLGQADRLTLEASLPFHTAYNKATPEQRAQLKHDWQVGYIMGKLDVDAKTSERILSRGKGAGVSKAHIKVVDISYSSFRHHVVRTTKSKSEAEPTHQRISKAHRALALDFLGNFEGEDRTEQIKQAIALLNALK